MYMKIRFVAVNDDGDDVSNLKNGSLKRTASFSFENEEDIVAYNESSSTDRALEKLFSAIGINTKGSVNVSSEWVLSFSFSLQKNWRKKSVIMNITKVTLRTRNLEILLRLTVLQQVFIFEFFMLQDILTY